MVPCIHRNGDITGYSVQYTGGGSTQTVSVSGESTTEATITELTASTTYSVGVAAVNDAGTGPYSSAMDQLTAGIIILLLWVCSLMNHHMSLLLLTVVAPVLLAGTTTATSISLSWTSGGSEGVSYEVMWQRDTSLECPDDDMDSATVSDGSIDYDIMGLQEHSRYSVSVMATNNVGSQISDPITGMTLVAGKPMTLVYSILHSPVAPSAAPTSVITSSDSSSSITVQWEMIPCIHHNGDITGYSVQYGIQGQSTDTMSAPGDSSGGTYDITGLQSSTTYSIRVAGVNSDGTGVYSNPRDQLTSGVAKE